MAVVLLERGAFDYRAFGVHVGNSVGTRAIWSDLRNPISECEGGELHDEGYTAT